MFAVVDFFDPVPVNTVKHNGSVSDCKQLLAF